MSEVAPPSAGPSAPASAGALLREARERQGVHIAVLAAAIKVSPRKLDALLKSCRSIKAKRLFLWLASRHQHAWLKYLTAEHYELGSGKRVIAERGRLEPTWQITVPREM